MCFEAPLEVHLEPVLISPVTGVKPRIAKRSTSSRMALQCEEMAAKKGCLSSGTPLESP